jgi:hypothetical protein
LPARAQLHGMAAGKNALFDGGKGQGLERIVATIFSG